MSAEVVTGGLMGVDDAERLRKRMLLLDVSVAESLTKLIGLVDDAARGKAHVALGYASWTAFLTDVLPNLQLALGTAGRREIVPALAERGMPTRAIARSLNVAQSTVVADLQRATDRGSFSPPATVTSLDGHQRPATRTTTDLIEDTDGSDAPGKTTTRRRPDITQSTFRAAHDLMKFTTRLKNLHDDDRYAKHLANQAYLRNAIQQQLDLLQLMRSEFPDGDTLD